MAGIAGTTEFFESNSAGQRRPARITLGKQLGKEMPLTLMILAMVVLALLGAFGMAALTQWAESDKTTKLLKRLLSKGYVDTDEVFVPPGTELNLEAYDYTEESGWGGRICVRTGESGEMHAECIVQEGRDGPNYENCLFVNRQCLYEGDRVPITLADELVVLSTKPGKSEPTVRFIKIRTEACPRRS